MVVGGAFVSQSVPRVIALTFSRAKFTLVGQDKFAERVVGWVAEEG